MLSIICKTATTAIMLETLMSGQPVNKLNMEIIPPAYEKQMYRDLTIIRKMANGNCYSQDSHQSGTQITSCNSKNNRVSCFSLDGGNCFAIKRCFNPLKFSVLKIHNQYH